MYVTNFSLVILFLPELRNYKSPHQREEVEEVSVTALSIPLNMVTVPIFGLKEFIHFLGGRSARYITFEPKCFGFQISSSNWKVSLVILVAIEIKVKYHSICRYS